MAHARVDSRHTRQPGVALAAGARRAFLLVVCLLSLTSYVTLVFTLFRASAGCIKGPKGLMEMLYRLRATSRASGAAVLLRTRSVLAARCVTP
jgi:hypothetical protein